MKKDGFYKNSKGEYVPSGTTVLEKPDLAQWAANCAVDYINFNSNAYNGIVEEYTALSLARTSHERESMEAADYGTFIHAMCRYSLENNIELESAHEMTNDFMNGLWKWKTKHNVKVIAMEHEVVTDTYGGRPDLVCEMDGVITLVDFKTGKGQYYDNWKYQLAGYRNAWNKDLIVQYEALGWANQGWESYKKWAVQKIQRHGILKFNKEKTKTKGIFS